MGGVVAAEDDEAGRCRVLGTVRELGFGPDRVEAESGVPGEGAEADENLCGEQLEFPGCVREAGVSFGGGRFVLWRGATDGSGDPESPQA